MVLLLSDPPVSTSTLGTIRLRNTTTEERDAFPVVRLPLAPGALRTADPLTVVGAADVPLPVAWRPYGPRWGDGSVRYATAPFRCRLGANQVKLVDVTTARTESPSAFVRHPNVEYWLTQVDDVGLGVEIDGTRLWMRQAARTVDAGGLWRERHRMRQRIPGGPYWIEIIVDFFRAMPIAEFWWRVGNSDPSNPNTVFTLSEGLHLLHRQHRVAIRHAPSRVRGTSTSGGVTKLRIVRTSGHPVGPTWKDGQMQWVKGVMVLDTPTPLAPGIETTTALAELVQEARGISKNWPDHGSFGAFGFAVDAPPWLSTQEQIESAAFTQAQQDLNAPGFVDANEWFGGTTKELHLYGNFRAPADPATQPEFGVTRFGMIARSAEPFWLLPMERELYREGSRFTHIREANLDVLRTTAYRPGLHLWEGRPHHTSPQKLGKTQDINVGETAARGYIPSHYSINAIVFSALLSCDPFLEEEVEHHCETLLAMWSNIPPSQGGNQNLYLFDSPRGIGRVNLSIAHLLSVLDRPQLAEEAVLKMRRLREEEWFGQFNAPMKLFAGATLPGQNLTVPYFHLWMEQQGVMGCYALYKRTGDANARFLALEVGRTLAWHGWQDRSTTIMVSNLYNEGQGFWVGAQPSRFEWVVGETSGARGRIVGWMEGRAVFHSMEVPKRFSFFEFIVGESSNARARHWHDVGPIQAIDAVWIGDPAGRLLTDEELLELRPPGGTQPPVPINFWLNVKYGDGADYALWSAPALLATRELAREDNDTALEARCTHLLGLLRSTRTATPGFDWRWAEWWPVAADAMTT
jgi:hypothetical protein